MSTSFYPVIGLNDRTKMTDVTDTHRRETGQEIGYNQQRVDSSRQRVKAAKDFVDTTANFALSSFEKESASIEKLASQSAQADALASKARDSYELEETSLNEKRIKMNGMPEGSEKESMKAVVNNMTMRQKHRWKTVENLDQTAAKTREMYNKRSDNWMNRLMRDEQPQQSGSGSGALLTPASPMEIATAEQLAPPPQPYVPPPDPYPDMPDSHGFERRDGRDLLPSGAITLPADNPYGNISLDDRAGMADLSAAEDLKNQGVIEDINMGLLNIGGGTQPITPYDLADLGIADQVLRALTKDPSKRRQNIAMLVNAIYVAMQSSPKKKHHRRY